MLKTNQANAASQTAASPKRLAAIAAGYALVPVPAILRVRAEKAANTNAYTARRTVAR